MESVETVERPKLHVPLVKSKVAKEMMNIIT